MGKDPSQIRREIEHTREDMSETVDALAYKLDVKERAKEKVHDTVHNIVAKPKQMLFGTKETAMHSVKEHVPSKSDIKSTAADAKETVADVADSAKHKAASAAQATGDAAQSAVQSVKKSPTGLIVGGLVLGLAAGWALPRTSLENRKIGSVADDVRDKALETGREVLDHGKEVATEAMSAATEAAKEVAEQTTETVKESASEHATELQDSTQQKVDEVKGTDEEVEAPTIVVNAPPPTY